MPSHDEIQRFNYLGNVEVISKILYFVSNVVLATPLFIFDNEWMKDMILKTSLISVGSVSVLSMIEGIKRICGLRYTELKQILIRLPIALVVSAATPYLFVEGIRLLNKATQMILKLGSVDVANIANLPLVLGGKVDTLFLILFTFLFLILCVPIVFYNGRRWFDLVGLAIMSPLAMTSWVFNSLNHYHKMWLNSLKNLSLVQLSYAAFITIIYFILFSVPFPPTFEGSIAKLFLMVGGLYRLAFPPQFIKSMTDKGDSSLTMINKLKNNIIKPKNPLSVK